LQFGYIQIPRYLNCSHYHLYRTDLEGLFYAKRGVVQDIEQKDVHLRTDERILHARVTARVKEVSRPLVTVAINDKTRVHSIFLGKILAQKVREPLMVVIPHFAAVDDDWGHQLDLEVEALADPPKVPR
jgi:hypothetical protein